MLKASGRLSGGGARSGRAAVGRGAARSRAGVGRGGVKSNSGTGGTGCSKMAALSARQQARTSPYRRDSLDCRMLWRHRFSCAQTTAMEHCRDVIKVTFVGAGSVEFTRNVVTDLCGYPEFRGELHLSLYDISAERLAHAEQLARRDSRQAGAGAGG